ncbi:MAG: alpha/beta hydrolase [Flavihumibacter sp.]|nr:alpha/beta hydrolase [Flavihumibacter sp.]
MKKIICFIIMVNYLQAVIAQNTKIPYGNNKAVGKYADIRGFKMYYEVYGSGQPVLFIHGNGGRGADFSNQVPFFEKNYQVIIADSRAQGKSKDTKDSLNYEMMADDYAALLTELKIDSAFVVGWSDGGIEGLLMAIRHPQKVKKLAVTGANLWPDSSAVYNEVLDMVRPFYNSLNKPNRNALEQAQWKVMHLLLDEPHIPLTDVQKIKCPTLVIGGDHDVIKEEHTMLIYKNIAQSYLWILPGSGHSTPIVYKDEFNNTILSFFQKPYKKFTKEDRFN